MLFADFDEDEVDDANTIVAVDVKVDCRVVFLLLYLPSVICL